MENENYEVIVLFDGKDVLEKLDNEKVDMLIIDVMMFNMDGWEFCREVCLFSSMLILMLIVLGEII